MNSANSFFNKNKSSSLSSDIMDADDEVVGLTGVARDVIGRDGGHG